MGTRLQVARPPAVARRDRRQGPVRRQARGPPTGRGGRRRGAHRERFERWIDTVASLPRRQTRVLTWPVLTVFGFIARPRVHAFLKPVAMQRAARAYGFDLAYSSKPNWDTYASFLELCRTVKRDVADLNPRDQID